MKALLMGLFICCWSCSGDVDYSPENEDLQAEELLKSAKAGETITIKAYARLFAIHNEDMPYITCIPEEYQLKMHSSGFAGGYTTLLGKVNLDSSPWYRENCMLGPGPTEVTVDGYGQVMGAHGDMYNYEMQYVADLAQMTFTGSLEVTGGTGRFEGASGHFDLYNGVLDEHGGSWEARGYLVLIKK